MKVYTIIAGVNGVGKSSLTGALKAERSDLGVIIDVDKLSAQLGSTTAGGKAAIEKIACCMEKGISFTQETTLSGVRTERTIQKAKGKGYTVRLYYVGLDALEESYRRIENRVQKGGHDIPREDVRRRFQTRFPSLIKILPYCDEARFFDNDNGFIEVAEYRNGELLTHGDQLPRWLCELREQIKAPN